jgi:hypothetical protein
MPQGFSVFVPIITQARLVLRKNFPTLVIHRSGFSKRCVGVSLGVYMYMVRNFSMQKCFLCIPIRFCLKITGPLESIFIATAMARNKGEKRINAINESIKSINLLSLRYIISLHLYK